MEYYECYTEALQSNAANEKKWKNFKEELETTKENLSEFIKHYSVDIMVPIGKKALVRGKLLHTNEITVCHGASYFSECSTKQAIDILEKRINNCAFQLDSLEKERELFTNKIDLPQDAFGGEGKEIIEEFDENAEIEWRRKHAESVRNQKVIERQQRENDKKDNDLEKIFEEYEMMEELAKELEDLEVEDDDTLKKILSGELKVPESKKRVAHAIPVDHDFDENKNILSQLSNNDLIAQNNQEIVDLLKNYRCKIKEVLRNVTKDDERNVNLFLDLIELKDEIEDDIRRMNDDESVESDEKDSDDETTLSIESKPPEDGKRVRFSKSLEDIKLIETKSEILEASSMSENSTIQIYFQHSDAKFTMPISQEGEVSHPGEIYAKFHKSPVPAKKSILKNKEKEKTEFHQVVNDNLVTNENQVKKVFLSQVIGEVIEHKKVESEEIIQVACKAETPKKLSKFKQMRMKT